VAKDNCTLPMLAALFTRRRKEAYEALHPETRHGSPTVSRQLGDTQGRSETIRFTADTAKKTGQSERAVQRDASRGERVAPEVLSQIAGTILDTGKTLDELASVPKESQQAKVDELRAARSARLLAEEQAKEARKTTAAVDSVIRLTEAQQFAEWLMARTDLNEIPMVISWLEGCKSKEVIAAMRREAA
jgi:ParB family chromosome partitioning protein